MPQMAPMNWLMLFSSFVLIFITCVNKIFYMSINSFDSLKNNKISPSSNLNIWKW